MMQLLRIITQKIHFNIWTLLKTLDKKNNCVNYPLFHEFHIISETHSPTIALAPPKRERTAQAEIGRETDQAEILIITWQWDIDVAKTMPWIFFLLGGIPVNQVVKIWH